MRLMKNFSVRKQFDIIAFLERMIERIAGDSLSYQNNQQFSTKDRDNDKWVGGHCAQLHHGAWWYDECKHSNLNGKYLSNGQIDWIGVVWRYWKNSGYSMKRAEMKIKTN